MKDIYVFQNYIEFVSEFDGSVIRIPISEIEQYRNDNLMYDFRIDDLPPASRQILGQSEDPIAVKLLNNFPSRSKEELREYMVVSPAQIRLALLQVGITPSTISTAINSIQDDTTRETASILWEYANGFQRNHPFVTQIGLMLGKTDEEIDAIFTTAKTLA
jgi:hypothetical protein